MTGVVLVARSIAGSAAAGAVQLYAMAVPAKFNINWYSNHDRGYSCRVIRG
eukprot:SAG31_NODE_5672_length_2391_cov_1.483857_4_plen_51_part_00